MHEVETPTDRGNQNRIAHGVSIAAELDIKIGFERRMEGA